MSYNSLQQALDASRRAAKKAYKAGRASADRCEEAIQETRDQLSGIISAIHQLDIQAEEAVDSLEEQLLEVGEKLEADFERHVGNFEQFHDRLERFTVTLFGRTMTGKSTLMEILTRGDGGSIGKGAQRTTRDIRTYRWNNLEVTDVPGVAAFGGEVDEEVAYEAARQADVILFLITDDAPQPAEAEHLARVMQLGKPVIGLINVKMALKRERDIRRFEKRHHRKFDSERIDRIVGQFQEMVREHGASGELDFYPVHLRARFLADQPDYSEHAEMLRELSRFDGFERRLLETVVERGPMIRTRTLGDAAVVPLLEMARELFRFAEANEQTARLFRDKFRQVRHWRPKHRRRMRSSIEEAVGERVDKLRERVPGFVDEFLEDDDIQDEWKALVDDMDLEAAVERVQQKVIEETEKSLRNFEEELEREIEIFEREFRSIEVSARRVIDTQSIGKYAIYAGATAFAIFSMITGGIGGALGAGIALVSGGGEIFWDWFTESRQDKLAKHRRKLTKQLSEHLDAMERDAASELEEWYDEEIDVAVVQRFQENLTLVASTLEDLATTQRELARALVEEVDGVNERIFERAVEELGAYSVWFPVKKVARVPGVETALVVSRHSQEPFELEADLEEMFDTPIRWVMDNGFDRSLIRQVIGPACEGVRSVDRETRKAEVELENDDDATKTRIQLAEQLTGLQVVRTRENPN